MPSVPSGMYLPARVTSRHASVALAAATYSASVAQSAVDGRFLLDQADGPPWKKMFPDADFRPAGTLARSASV